MEMRIENLSFVWIKQKLSYVWSAAALLVCLCLLIADSMGSETPNDGGYNRGQQQSGNAEGGTRIWLGYIAVHPSGKYFVSRSQESLVLGVVATKKTELLTGLDYIERVIFDEKEPILYATQTNKKYDHVYLLAYHLEKRAVLWRQELDGRFNLDRMRLDREPTTDGIVTTELYRVRMWDATEGRLRWTYELPTRGSDYFIVDVDLVSQIGKVVITARETWSEVAKVVPTQPSRQFAGNGYQVLSSEQIPTVQKSSVFDQPQPPMQQRREKPAITAPEMESKPTTDIIFLTYGTGRVSSVSVPNCGGELIIANQGRRAFLGPTECKAPPKKLPPSEQNNGSAGQSTEPTQRASNSQRNYDPVSVIDLVAERFERNLPGYGPIALSKDGSMAVAFMDRKALDLSLFQDFGQIPPQDGSQYLLMFIHTESLKFTWMEIGDTLPRYSITPDGKHLLIDASNKYQTNKTIQILDIKNKILRTVEGPSVSMDQFVLTPNAEDAYVLDGALYRLTFSEKKLTPVVLSFTPKTLNISPLGDLLFLKDGKTDNVHIYCVYRRQLCGEVVNELYTKVDLADDTIESP